MRRRGPQGRARPVAARAVADRRGRPGRGLRVASLVVGAGAVCAATVVPAGAADQATIDRDGWWYRARTAETPLGAPPVPLPAPPSTVPEGAIAVGAIGGEPDKVAAVGIVLAAPVGSTVERFVLRLREVDAGAATVGAAQAAIVACPITSFWAGGPSGPWETRPEADCDVAAVAGRRADDGTWTFDLAPVARAWLDPFAAVPADGVLLAPAAGSTATFQVSFADLASGGYALDVALAPPPEVGAPVATDGTPELEPGGERGDVGFEPGSASLGDLGPAPEPGPASPPAQGPTTQGGRRPVAAPALPAAASRSVFSGIPWAALLLVPVALGLALATTVALGELGEPVALVRERGVSRALAARERAEARRRTAQGGLG